MDVGKVVPNHYKFGFCFLYPYLFNLLLLCEKVFEKTNSPPLLVKLLSHIESSIGIKARPLILFLRFNRLRGK